MIALYTAVRTEAFYTAICLATSKSAKTAFAVWISWKNIIITERPLLKNFGLTAYR